MMPDDTRWDVPEWVIILACALAAALFLLAGPGCYSRTVRCTAPGAGGTVLFEQEWSERSLLKPDGWPDVLMSTPRTQTRTTDPQTRLPDGGQALPPNRLEEAI
jgi:hypothetical protein